MKFCEKCDNMYYLQLSPDDENQIIYKCRNCGNEDKSISSDTISISKQEFQTTEENFDIYINGKLISKATSRTYILNNQAHDIFENTFNEVRHSLAFNIMPDGITGATDSTFVY